MLQEKPIDTALDKLPIENNSNMELYQTLHSIDSEIYPYYMVYKNRFMQYVAPSFPEDFGFTNIIAQKISLYKEDPDNVNTSVLKIEISHRLTACKIDWEDQNPYIDSFMQSLSMLPNA